MHWHLKTRKSWWLPRLRPGGELPHSLRLQSWAQGSRPKVVRRIYFSIILARIRDACGNQNGWTFKKVPNGPPPPSFSENYIADFATKVRDFATKVSDFATKVRLFILAGLLYIIWSYFPWDACCTTVQHGNWLKTYPEKTILYHFHAEKALFKGPKSAI